MTRAHRSDDNGAPDGGTGPATSGSRARPIALEPPTRGHMPTASRGGRRLGDLSGRGEHRLDLQDAQRTRGTGNGVPEQALTSHDAGDIGQRPANPP